MNTDKLKGTIVHLEDDFGISYQDMPDGIANCHCEINRWTPSVLKRCRETIARLQTQYDREIVMGISDKDDIKHHKFLRCMGFEFFKNKWILDDGKDKIISIWVRYHDQHRKRLKDRIGTV